jgi:pimeloyl-ACP methyl ester carboxylesterase
LRRAYYDCRYGQLHLHNAIPGGGGFDELTSVICLHGPGETGRVFMPLLHALGQVRSVYALDLPGAGESDPAPGTTPADAALHAVTDFVDSMRIRVFDLVVRGEMLPVARKLLETRGQAVRRVVVLGGEGLAGGARISLLSSREVQAPDFPGRVVELLGGTA